MAKRKPFPVAQSSVDTPKARRIRKAVKKVMSKPENSKQRKVGMPLGAPFGTRPSISVREDTPMAVIEIDYAKLAHMVAQQMPGVGSGRAYDTGPICSVGSGIQAAGQVNYDKERAAFLRGAGYTANAAQEECSRKESPFRDASDHIYDAIGYASACITKADTSPFSLVDLVHKELDQLVGVVADLEQLTIPIAKNETTGNSEPSIASADSSQPTTLNGSIEGLGIRASQIGLRLLRLKNRIVL